MRLSVNASLTSLSLKRTSMPVRNALLVVLFALAAFFNTLAQPVDPGATAQDIDRSIKPGDDFYRYANGTWLKTVVVPVGQTSYDTRAILREKTAQRVRALIENAAMGKAAKGSIAQKVGDY